MQFSFVEVIKTKENFHYIEWDMVPATGESIDDWNFRILWSNDPDSGYLEIDDENGDPIEIDGAVGPLSYTHQRRQYDFNQDHYYKVLAVPKAVGPASIESKIVFIGMFSDGAHEVMKDVENTLYNYYQGEPCIILKRKSWGARCPVCWSQQRQQIVRTHCDTCKGTGFVTGYYQPIEIQMSFDSDPKKSDLNKEFENVYDTKRSRISNYPLVRPKDLVINQDDNKRYVIVHVETTKLPKLAESQAKLSKQNYILSQLLTLEELNPNDNEYFIDIDNIPEIPQAEEGNTGSTLPFFNDHQPVTVDAPLEIDNGKQHVVLNYDPNDFSVVDGMLHVIGGGGGGTSGYSGFSGFSGYSGVGAPPEVDGGYSTSTYLTSQLLDGGGSASVYLTSQLVDGGSA